MAEKKIALDYYYHQDRSALVRHMDDCVLEIAVAESLPEAMRMVAREIGPYYYHVSGQPGVYKPGWCSPQSAEVAEAVHIADRLRAAAAELEVRS